MHFIAGPDFSFDVLTVHEEREVSIDGKTLRNRKTGNPSSSTVVGPKQLKQYKGIIGNYSFVVAKWDDGFQITIMPKLL
jgi:hypothetical protein